MRYFISTMTATLILVMFCSPGMAGAAEDKKPWDVVFASDLAKIKSPKKTDGLGYTVTEEEALDQAIKKAIDNGGPVCETTKMAVGLNFNPYSVLMGVFKSGGKVKLDQLCMCATETEDSDATIGKGIMKQAADDAVAKNLLTRDEVSEAQCLEQGLAFTETLAPIARINLNETATNYSP